MFGDGGAKKEAKRARQEEEARQFRVKVGTNRTREDFAKAFDDKYYEDLMTKTKEAYLPGVERQFAEASKQLRASLLRAGLGNSQVAINKKEDADTAHADAINEVTQRGVGFQNERKKDVAYAENTVLNQLNQTADMGAAFANASAQIANNTKPPAMPMLGQVFTDLGAGLATQADLERYNQNRYTVFGRIPGWNERNRYTRNVGGGT
jgi:hypothetical protein